MSSMQINLLLVLLVFGHCSTSTCSTVSSTIETKVSYAQFKDPDQSTTETLEMNSSTMYLKIGLITCTALLVTVLGIGIGLLRRRSRQAAAEAEGLKEAAISGIRKDSPTQGITKETDTEKAKEKAGGVPVPVPVPGVGGLKPTITKESETGKATGKAKVTATSVKSLPKKIKKETKDDSPDEEDDDSDD